MLLKARVAQGQALSSQRHCPARGRVEKQNYIPHFGQGNTENFRPSEMFAVG